MTDLRQITILLVEDDLGDQKLIKKSMELQKIANELFISDNAEDALDYLARSKAGNGNCPIPEIILLDLNMPDMGGEEFLRRIKADNELDAIPVVILTTSDSERDIIESYKLHASGYIKKPIKLEDFHQVLQKLEEYWFVLCKRVTERTLSCIRNR